MKWKRRERKKVHEIQLWPKRLKGCFKRPVTYLDYTLIGLRGFLSEPIRLGVLAMNSCSHIVVWTGKTTGLHYPNKTGRWLAWIACHKYHSPRWRFNKIPKLYFLCLIGAATTSYFYLGFVRLSLLLPPSAETSWKVVLVPTCGSYFNVGALSSRKTASAL